MLFPLPRIPVPIYLLGCFLLMLQVLVRHITSGEFSQNALCPQQLALTATVANTTLSFFTWPVLRPLMSEIRFQEGSCCFLTYGCLAFIYYSSVEMADKDSLVEIVVPGFEKSTVILIK